MNQVLKDEANAMTDEVVNVSAKLRKAHLWFEILAVRLKSAAVKERRTAERAHGPELTPKQLRELSDTLEEIQLKLIPLETQRETIVTQLLAHWGHTGIEEIEGRKGKTLISTSFEMCVDADVVKAAVSTPLWYKVTSRVLQAPLLLQAGAQEGPARKKIREAIEAAMKVKKLKVSITPPSSRRPKSGETAEDSA